jgi:hypothetical protein
MADDRDDDTPPADSKSGKGPKKRFQERDDADDEGDDDRPRKKRRTEDDEEEPPRKKRRDEDDEDRPQKRRADDDGPRVKTNDNIPIVMLLAFIGSAVALLATCVSCGWFSFAWISGDSGGGWGGNELEITSISRTQAGPNSVPQVSWAGVTKQAPNTNDGKYYLVMKCGSQLAVRDFNPGTKGVKWNGSGPQQELRGSSGKLEVWIEKRPNPVANGKTVSNVFTLQ